MKKLETFGGITIMTLGAASFYFIFFKIAPWVASTIPPGAWQELLTIITYAVIGYFGGLALPILIFLWGVSVLLTGLFDL